MTEEKYMSLYDYRGRRDYAGDGKQVFEAAKKKGIQTKTKYISNPAYQGEVMMYPESFLDEYFNSKLQSKKVEPKENDELPF